MTEQQKDQGLPAGIDQAELEEQSGEELPDREAMMMITPPGDTLGPPPLAD